MSVIDTPSNKATAELLSLAVTTEAAFTRTFLFLHSYLCLMLAIAVEVSKWYTHFCYSSCMFNVDAFIKFLRCQELADDGIRSDNDNFMFYPIDIYSTVPAFIFSIFQWKSWRSWKKRAGYLITDLVVVRSSSSQTLIHFSD